jgi:DNA-binding CsgD family transcriptional regulator
VRVYPRVFTAELELDRGNLDGARAALDDALVPPDTPSNTQTSFWYAARLRLLVESGEHARALTLADECLQRFAGAFDSPSFAPWRGLRALALHGLGRAEEAERSAEAELELARVWGAPRALGRALRTLATVRRTDALPLLEEAVALLEGTPARLELARCLAHLGRVLRLERRPADAREPLRRALELADVCGAEALREHARGELYAAGARPRSAAVRGPEALTPSERRVAELAVAGQSNRDIAQGLFVTPKTVEVHLSSAYRKLGIRSRRELEKALG